MLREIKNEGNLLFLFPSSKKLFAKDGGKDTVVKRISQYEIDIIKIADSFVLSASYCTALLALLLHLKDVNSFSVLMRLTNKFPFCLALAYRINYLYVLNVQF